MHAKLDVGNSWDTTLNDDLRNVFAQADAFVSVAMIKDHATGAANPILT